MNVSPSTPPRVVHVYKDVYPPVEGGIERTIYHMARLTRGEFAPSVIVASRDRRSRRRVIAGDVEVTEVAAWGRALSTPLAPGFVRALRTVRADLFHFHMPHPTGELAYLISRLKTPAVATYHSDVVRQRGALRIYRPFLDRFLARMSVVMPTTQRYLDTSEMLQAHRARCRVLALGLPLEDYDADETIRRQAKEYRGRWGDFVFFIGVLRYYKGLEYLLEAAARLPKMHAVIAGEGPEGDRLKARAAELGVAERVHFLGRVDHARGVALFHAAGAFCLPATERSEAYGLCQIEAMACGLPVVSTNLPTGVPEVNRHEASGLIVEPRNAESLADALQKILNEPVLRERLSEGARRRARELFTAERMASELKEVYRQVLEMAEPD